MICEKKDLGVAMNNTRLYDKLEISNSEMKVFANHFTEKFRKYSIYPVMIFCAFLSFMIIKHANIGAVKYLIVPFSILIIICLKYNIKQHEHLLYTYKFKVDKESLCFYSEAILIEILIKQIISVEDKSFYYDFRGRNNRGWHHVLNIKIANGKEFIDSVDKKALFAYKNLKDDNTVELQIHSLNLKHEDYLNLINFLHTITSND